MAGYGRIDLFGPFVEVSPDEHAHSISTGANGLEPRPSAPHEVFDAFVLPIEGVAGKRQCATLPCSVALHGVAAVALIALPLLMSSELPGPSGAVQAFFVQPMVAPPPAPPPPAPASHAAPPRAAPALAADSVDRLTAPVEVPSELWADEGLDLGIVGGVAGGVPGGVSGGVVGGVVGGLGDAVASAPPPVAPVRAGGHIKEPVKVRYVAPVYPKVAMEAAVQGIVIIDAVIDATGRVAEARILRGVPILDDAALEAVRQWEYTPTLLDGVPTPVRMTITVTFRLKSASQG